MTLTIANVNSADIVALNFRIDDFDNYCLVDQQVSQDGYTAEALFKYLGSDPSAPASVRIGLYYKPDRNNGWGETTLSVRKTTIATETIDDVEYSGPVTTVISHTVPGRNLYSDNGRSHALNVFSWIYPGTTTGSAATLADPSYAFVTFYKNFIASIDLNDVPEIVA